MSTTDRASQSPGDQEKSPEEIRRDIEQTREQLGDTVEALAEKTDVKAQAQQRADALKDSAKQMRDEFKAKGKAATPESANAGAQQVVGAAKQNPFPVAMGGAFLMGLLVGRWSK
jgi:chromosome segregation ATPase